jgi:dienelactone hydrolase
VRRAGAVVLVLNLVALVVFGAVLAARERGGPEHRDVSLPRGIPATFYLPATERPPAVVVGHGYSGDRATMSSLARSLASAGYAVLAIDFSGHGANTNPYEGADRPADLAAALGWLEDSGEVDSDRLAVLAHSMGASAALDLVMTDPRPSATVVLGSSYRSTVRDPVPRNVLFLVGGNEGVSVREASEAMAGELEAAGANAEVVPIDGADHIRILWFDQTVTESVAWLDEAFGIDRDERAAIDDPRLGIAGAYFACALVAFVALGIAAGRVGPRSEGQSAAGIGSFAAVAAALVVAAPIAFALDPTVVFGTGFGDVVTYLGVAGLVLVAIRVRALPRPSRVALRRGATATLAALVGAFVLLAPLGGVTHRLVPTPERAVLAALAIAILLPLFALFQSTLRRGPVLRASAASVAGHGVLLVALAAGVVVGPFPGVVALALPLLAGVFGLVEVFGIAAYSVTRNGLLVGIVEATWVGGIAAIAMPLP